MTTVEARGQRTLPLGHKERSLNATAQEFQPAPTPLPTMASKPLIDRRIYNYRASFSIPIAVPFTPSQGICTPSPSNFAAVMMARRGRSDLHSDPYSVSSPDSNQQNGYGGAFLVPAVYPVYPVHFSPGGAHHTAFVAPMTPHSPAHWSPLPSATAVFAVPSPSDSGGAHPAAYVGSPAVAQAAPGRAIFAQYLAQEGYGSDRASQSPSQQSGHHVANASESASMTTSSAPSSGGKSDKSSKHSTCAGAVEEAIAWCAVRGYLTQEPPHAVLELASLTLTYGIPIDMAADVASNSSSSGSINISNTSPVPIHHRAPATTDMNVNVKLNARQRRTLRRALDRAVTAIDAVLGIEKGHPHPSSNDAGALSQIDGLEFSMSTASAYHTPMKSRGSTNSVNSSAAFIPPPPPPPPPPPCAMSTMYRSPSPVYVATGSPAPWQPMPVVNQPQQQQHHHHHHHQPYYHTHPPHPLLVIDAAHMIAAAPPPPPPPPRQLHTNSNNIDNNMYDRKSGHPSNHYNHHNHHHGKMTQQQRRGSRQTSRFAPSLSSSHR